MQAMLAVMKTPQGFHYQVSEGPANNFAKSEDSKQLQGWIFAQMSV